MIDWDIYCTPPQGSGTILEEGGGFSKTNCCRGPEQIVSSGDDEIAAVMN